MRRLRQRITRICANCPEGPSRMTVVRRKLPRCTCASHPDPQAPPRPVGARALQSRLHRRCPAPDHDAARVLREDLTAPGSAGWSQPWPRRETPRVRERWPPRRPGAACHGQGDGGSCGGKAMRRLPRLRDDRRGLPETPRGARTAVGSPARKRRTSFAARRGCHPRS